MAEKKGFLHYLTHPGEVAKKMLPFIDVDAIMAENKQRYKELGVNPELAKSVIGGALNPLAFPVGVGTAKSLTGLLSFYNKRKAIKQLSKDILSPKGVQRYIDNTTSSLKNTLKDLAFEKQMLSSAKGKSMFSKNALASRKVDEHIDAVKGGLEYLRTPNFIDEYTNIVKHKMKNTPFNLRKLEPNVAGSYRSYQGLESGRNYSTSAYPGYAGVPSSFKGSVQLSPKAALNPYSTPPVNELKHSVQDALRGYRYSTKQSIPLSEKGQPIALAEARLSDSMTGGKEAVARAKYLLKPHEISARLSEIRTNPSKSIGAYKSLKSIFGSDKAVKWAKDNLWGLTPASFVNYTKKKEY